MKILITGIAGFAARHFLDYLNVIEPGSEVAGIYHETLPEFDVKKLGNLTITFYQLSLLEKDKFAAVLQECKPAFILHLAGKSSVANSWKDPSGSITDNTNFFLNIVESVRVLNWPCRILSVGSTEEYGNANAGLPLKETDCPEPASPYGVARVLQQKLVAIYANSYKLDIVHTRSFNHIGPNQKPEYVIASFAKQVVQQDMEGKKEIILKTGDVNVVRDFSDVRDVVKAYYQLLYKGRKGQTYNVCSGNGYVLKDIIQLLAKKIGKPVHDSIDEEKFRPAENKTILGSFEKINKETGWKPEISIEKSIEDIIEYWRGILSDIAKKQ
ncbi:MAG: GDP-mannose 4,6-dehydratase [Bacteroidetes bacterium]|nr:GDP-mannose 4,6-dehydratase [Bacteroidota bacterium]MBS1756515.1 GDP-mannose 4,6-dehydratase [Bacteroidota bacterium]